MNIYHTRVGTISGPVFDEQRRKNGRNRTLADSKVFKIYPFRVEK